jgi:hypothetical protein
MRLATPHPECVVDHAGEYIRARVGTGAAADADECYRTVATLALTHKFTRVLIIGLATGDAHAHLAARDAIVALAELGVPAGFRIAFVGTTSETLNGYRHAALEAANRALRAKVFTAEDEAVAWLTSPEVH